MPATTPFEEQVRQAVETLFSYNLERFVYARLKKLELPHSGNEALLKSTATLATLGQHPDYRVELAELVASIDELQETGPQHVFLFRFPEGDHPARLALLRDPGWLRGRLAGRGVQEAFDRSQFLWDAAAPELVAVRHNPTHHLILKWVESRDWEEKVGERIDPNNGNRLADFAPRQERSVNFFRLDLDSGDSVLLIQKLRQNAQVPLQTELALYRQQLQELLGYDPCERVLVEPVARRMMVEEEAEIRHWKVILPGGQTRSGTTPERFTLPSELEEGAFAALELDYDWRPVPQPAIRVRVRMNARADHLEIADACEPGHHAAILARAREGVEEPIHDADLRAVAAREPSLRSVLAKLDLHLVQLKPTSVDSRPMVREEWLESDTVQRAFEALARQNAARFGVSYYVYLQAGEAGNARRLRSYATRTEVPPAVDVRHQGKRHRVPTADKVWPELSLVAAPAPSQPRVPPDVILAVSCGAVLLALLLVLIFAVPNPTPFVELVFRVILALAAGGLAAALLGHMHVQKGGKMGKKRKQSAASVSADSPSVRIRAGGGAAFFVVVFLINPPELVSRAQPEATLRFKPSGSLSFAQAVREVEERFGRTVVLRCDEPTRGAMLKQGEVTADSLQSLLERLRYLSTGEPLAYEVRVIEGVGVELTCPRDRSP